MGGFRERLRKDQPGSHQFPRNIAPHIALSSSTNCDLEDVPHAGEVSFSVADATGMMQGGSGTVSWGSAWLAGARRRCTPGYLSPQLRR